MLYTVEEGTELKRIGAIVGILIVLIFLRFYNCVHQFGIIKKCFDTVDARYKHEEGQCTYKNEARSFNHCSSGRAVSITFCSVCL